MWYPSKHRFHKALILQIFVHTVPDGKAIRERKRKRKRRRKRKRKVVLLAYPKRCFGRPQIR